MGPAHPFQYTRLMSGPDEGGGPAARAAQAGDPADPRWSALPKWFLSFDCATKSFAFCLCYVDLARFAANKEKIRSRAAAAREALGRGPCSPEALYLLSVALAELDAETRRWLRFVDGETVDLFPGRPDRSVHTVERIRAVEGYLSRRVRPALGAAPAGEKVRALVEFQMGANAPARSVAAALIALLADMEDVLIVGPSLKNKVAVCQEGRYYNFADRYANAYGANKAHAKYNFERLESAFGTGVPPMRPPSLRGHVADCVMQVLGHVVLGDDVPRF
jgi:hypothetical protein